VPAPRGAPQAAAAGGAPALLPPGRGRRRPSSPRAYGGSVAAPLRHRASARRRASRPRPHPPRPSAGIFPSAERAPAVPAVRSATGAERASLAVPLQDTVARVKLDPGCPPLFGIRAGSRCGEGEPVLPFVFRSSPSSPRSRQSPSGVPGGRPGCSALPAAPAPGRGRRTLSRGCSLTRVTAKMELLLYKKLIKRRT